MYLSRLIINPRCRRARKDVLEAYEMHRTLMRAFPEGTDGSLGRILWRLDMDRPTKHRVVYVQSEVEPDWSRIATKHSDYFLEPAETVVDENPACKRIPEEKLLFPAGHVLAFRLRANPTKKIGSTAKHQRLDGVSKNNGKRIGLLKEEEQLNWLRSKAASGGFLVRSASAVCEDDFSHLSKGRQGQDRKLSLLSVRFDGVLQVTKPDQFLHTIRSGIGPGKAFGFGLLSVKPVRPQEGEPHAEST